MIEIINFEDLPFVHNGKIKRGAWKDSKNRKLYAEWLRKILEYENPEDWYQISKNLICDNYGRGLLKNYYYNSPINFIKDVFSNYEWLDWKFKFSPRNFWSDSKNHKKFAKWLGETLNYKNLEDWYQITQNLVYDNYGSGLLHNYSGSISLFLKKIFPEYEWFEWKFKKTPSGFWLHIENRKRFAEWLGETLNYKNPEDWYQINIQLISDNYGGGLLSSYYNSSPFLFVKEMFPEHNWQKAKFIKKYSQGQIEWAEFLKIHIPDIRHALNHDDGEYKIPNSNYSADGYSKKENTIFEYHGDTFHGNPELYDRNEIFRLVNKTYGELYDNTMKKQKFCEDSGFKYVFIWESKWYRGKNVIIQLQRKFRESRQRQ